MKKCVVCECAFYESRPDKKFCSTACYEKSRGSTLVCIMCFKEYKGKKGRLYCGMKCAGLSKKEAIIKRNIENRKYPKIEGLSRSQVYLRLNPDSAKKYYLREQNKRFIVIDYLGGKCSYCGYDKDKRALVLDHINSDGKSDRKRLGNRISRYYCTRLDEAKGKLQVLCANCNLIKSFDCNEHNTSRRVK